MLKIDVSHSPSDYHNYASPNSIVVVIDIFRATSAMVTAFDRGIDHIVPFANVDETKAMRAQGYLIAAERDAMKVDGFDFGNSPRSYLTADIEGKKLAITTTNGTQSIDVAKDAMKMVIGAFTNITALSNWLIEQESDVLLQCSGWKNKYNLEDTLYAGALTKILRATGKFDNTSDSALAAEYLFEVSKEDTHKFLRNSSHRRRLANLNLKEDIKYCLTPDLSDVIPVLENGRLIKM